MINFSLNTCWRLIPTKGDKGAFSFAAFSLFRSYTLLPTLYFHDFDE